MKIIYKYLVFLFLIVALISCTEKEIDKLELQVKVKGKISLYSQFGEEIKDYSNAAVTFTDTYKEYIAEIDTAGNYELIDLTTGSYNIFVTAHGFVTRKIEGTQFLGGEIWQQRNFSLSQPSTAIVSDLEITNENGILYLNGQITNDQKPDAEYFNHRVIIYTHNTSSVSPVNYNSAYSLNVETNEANEFKSRMYMSSLESFYCVVCGAPSTYGIYYGGIGTPSNVVGYFND